VIEGEQRKEEGKRTKIVSSHFKAKTNLRLHAVKTSRFISFLAVHSVKPIQQEQLVFYGTLTDILVITTIIISSINKRTNS